MKRWKPGVAFALVTITLVAGPRATNAQGVLLGFKLGPTFSNIDASDDTGETSSITSFGGGAFLRFGLGGFGLQPELLALTKGAESDDPGDDNLKLKLDYVEVPLFLHFGLSQGAISPYAMFGPTIAFEIGCEAELDVGGTEVEIDCDDQDADIVDRKGTDFGIAGALGVAFAAGPGNLLLEGRYTHGLTDITDNDNTDVKNRSFAVFVGYSIGLGRR